MREIELEFKQLLDASQYEALMEHFHLRDKKIINNRNFYYDTANQILKQNNAALRIRHTADNKEITLKIKKNLEENIEINVRLTDNDIPNNISVKELPAEIKEIFAEWEITSDLKLIQKIETDRRELMLDEGLLVLDKTYFLGNVVDYELEFEVTDYNIGQKAFERLLNKFNIARNTAKPKIARAFEYSKKLQ
ncbi:CYTH domain-containing protein [Gemella sp. GH3]|uniref:CYTH domain-containing protein n=1 Tax=unclassified Gemella TaxID=2624949 RepID=UPI0015CFB09D|nr:MULTISPECIES: CYTH domain-containing protein [unclassified Gemella]MBF0714591.1 CYTH domain-containing protein [Gemella sp. GH3.1]NYS51543.1 CYTH domain-containing protein [Gemella sp. GH3]